MNFWGFNFSCCQKFIVIDLELTDFKTHYVRLIYLQLEGHWNYSLTVSLRFTDFRSIKNPELGNMACYRDSQGRSPSTKIGRLSFWSKRELITKKCR